LLGIPKVFEIHLKGKAVKYFMKLYPQAVGYFTSVGGRYGYNNGYLGLVAKQETFYDYCLRYSANSGRLVLIFGRASIEITEKNYHLLGIIPSLIKVWKIPREKLNKVCERKLSEGKMKEALLTAITPLVKEQEWIEYWEKELSRSRNLDRKTLLSIYKKNLTIEEQKKEMETLLLVEKL
jgi:hypothetical protein